MNEQHWRILTRPTALMLSMLAVAVLGSCRAKDSATPAGPIPENERILTASDEPPIRVKGGSLEFEILSKGSEKWVADPDDAGAWTFHTVKTRGNKVALLFVPAPDPTKCSPAFFGKSDVTITVTDDDKNSFSAFFSAKRNRSEAKKDNTDLAPDAKNSKLLVLPTGAHAYISAVTFGSAATCSFNAGDVGDVYLFEYK